LTTVLMTTRGAMTAGGGSWLRQSSRLLAADRARTHLARSRHRRAGRLKCAGKHRRAGQQGTSIRHKVGKRFIREISDTMLGGGFVERWPASWSDQPVRLALADGGRPGAGV
jgi:hypothetical protein